MQAYYKNKTQQRSHSDLDTQKKRIKLYTQHRKDLIRKIKDFHNSVREGHSAREDNLIRLALVYKLESTLRMAEEDGLEKVHKSLKSQ